MKKENKLIQYLLFTSVFLFGISVPNQVFVASEVESKADITFVEPSPSDHGDGVTKPDTDGDIIVPDPEDSGSTTGPLRLSHVPNFHFGKRTISTKNQVYHALYERYKVTNNLNQAIGKYQSIPHFVQVVDERGVLDRGWTLSVSASKFEDTKHRKLENTFIRLSEQKITNTVFDYSGVPGDTESRVTGFLNGTSLDLGTSSAIVMKTVGNQSTSNSKTSSTFNHKYTSLQPIVDGTVENSGVEIHTPAKDIKETTLYTSTITWTLVDGI